MPASSDNREAHVRRIISEPLDIIESEHGLAGLDHVLEMVQGRRNSAIMSLEDDRKKAEK